MAFLAGLKMRARIVLSLTIQNPAGASGLPLASLAARQLL
jgi:hypothetical protein